MIKSHCIINPSLFQQEELLEIIDGTEQYVRKQRPPFNLKLNFNITNSIIQELPSSPDIFNDWQFSGSLSAGVVDQRIDNTESIENIEEYTKPLLKYFKPEQILITSECGFGHVPIEITRNKLKKLVEAAQILRKKY